MVGGSGGTQSQNYNVNDDSVYFWRNNRRRRLCPEDIMNNTGSAKHLDKSLVFPSRISLFIGGGSVLNEMGVV